MKISIIIPVYNKADFLEDCLQSVIGQIGSQEDAFEIVLVDDGSTDGSADIIHRYASLFQYIVALSQPNSGVSVARNNAIKAAKGDYVLFLDSDDELIPGALRQVYEYLKEHSSVDMLVTRQLRCIGDQKRLVSAPNLEVGKSYSGVEAYHHKYVRTNAGGGICSTAFLRKHQLQFPVGIRNAEDTIFFGLVQALAGSVVYLDILLYKINMLEDSASRTDETKLAHRHAETVNAMAEIRNRISCTEEQKGILEYILYQLLSNTIGHFVRSKELRYRNFCKEVHLGQIFPIVTQHMCKMRKKAKMMNFSVRLFYILSWLKK